MEIKYCQNCNAAMPVESKFCTECGMPFPKAEKKEAKPAGNPDRPDKPESPLDTLMTRPEDSPAFPPENKPVLPWDRPVTEPPAEPPMNRPVEPPTDNPPPQSNQNVWDGQQNPPVNGPGSPWNRPVDNPPAQNSQNVWNGQQNPPVNGPGGPWNRPEDTYFSQNQVVRDPGLDTTVVVTPPVQNQTISAPPQGPAEIIQNPGGIGGGAGAYGQSKVIYDEDLRGTPLEPISAWGWLGILLLMAIPLVNLVLTIVWACGGCRKNAKKSFARGVLLYVLLGILLILLFGFLLVTVFINIPAVEDVLNEILAEFGYYIV